MEGRRTGSLKLVTWDLRSAARGRRKGVRSKGAQEGGSVQLGSRGGRDYGLRTRLNRKQGELLVRRRLSKDNFLFIQFLRRLQTLPCLFIPFLPHYSNFAFQSQIYGSDQILIDVAPIKNFRFT